MKITIEYNGNIFEEYIELYVNQEGYKLIESLNDYNFYKQLIFSGKTQFNCSNFLNLTFDTCEILNNKIINTSLIFENAVIPIKCRHVGVTAIRNSISSKMEITNLCFQIQS